MIESPHKPTETNFQYIIIHPPPGAPLPQKLNNFCIFMRMYMYY